MHEKSYILPMEFFDRSPLFLRGNKITILFEFHHKELFISTDCSEVDKEWIMKTFIFRTFWRVPGFVTQLQDNVEADT